MLEQYRNTGAFHLNMVHFQYEHKMGLMKSLCYVMDHFDLPPYGNEGIYHWHIGDRH